MPRAALFQSFTIDNDSASLAWVDNTYIPKLMQASGSGRATRLEAKDNSAHNVIFIEAPSVSSISQGNEVLTSAEDKEHLAQLSSSLVWRTFEQIYDSGHKDSAPAYVAYALIEPAAGGVEEFHAWYNEEHLEHVKDVNGWQRSQRYELQQSSKGQDGSQLAYYEWSEEPDMTGPVVSRNLGNARSVKNMSSAQSVEMKVLKVAKLFP